MQLRYFIFFFTCLLHTSGTLGAQDVVPLITGGNEWRFNNGQEFPGATGALTLDEETLRDGKPSLRLVGDFTGGGGYVEAGRSIPDVDIRNLSLWVKNPNSDHFTMRLNDASGQTHQINLKTEPTADWQRIDLPLDRFFARRGQADAVTSIAKYESWGGAKDGNWHGPAKAIYLLLGNEGANKVRTLWLNDILITPRPQPAGEMKSLIAIGDLADWKFSNGAEFKGAEGSLTEVNGGQLRLSGDFTGGGAYVAAIRNLEDLQATKAPLIKMRVKSVNARTISVQLVDGSGQTHQTKGFPIVADGEWHEVAIEADKIAGGEHWGGANDGKWNGGIRQMALSVTAGSDEKGKRPEIFLSDVQAEITVPVFALTAAFGANFDDGKMAGWSAGSIKDGALLMERTLEEITKPCAVASPEFPASGGRWEIKLRYKPDLHSPDNSYNAVVRVDCLAEDGSLIESLPIADVFGEQEWKEAKVLVDFPTGTARARLHAQLNKTYGEFRIDDVRAAYLAPMKRGDDRVTRLLFSTAQLGNLLFPNDPRKVSVRVETRKALKEHQMQITGVVRDYWGSEHTGEITVALKAEGDHLYGAEIDLSNAPLEIGRYYELHASIPGSDAQTEAFSNHTSFAVLPEAVTRKYKPEQIPFTSRNWDNRISEYIRLTDRLGIRICGLWGGWSDVAPYKPEAPGLELCKELGMGWLSNTPIAGIERGETKYNETALREGVRNFLETYAGHRPLVMNLGNEPHGKGDVVLRNVAAYKVVYEEIKKFDPSIPVVATSVEPNEEYFKAGYGKWCDAYDFHIYETAPNVRRTMREYGALMKKYDVVKPLWSTELGLNSQGQPRHVVAVEVFKKLSSFFAEGGENVSWFGLLYPDGDGKSHGSSGDSHNVFDCRFNRYCPRLDAVAYYNIVNAISIKKFVEEKHYENGTHALLFRDAEGQSLQVVWNEEQDADVLLPLSGVGEVDVIRIDGRRTELDAAKAGVSLRVTNDPVLLLYKGGSSLAAKLESPPVAWRALAPPFEFELQGKATVTAPPFWKVEKSGERVTLTPPKMSAVREVEVSVKLDDARGELVYRLPVAHD